MFSLCSGYLANGDMFRGEKNEPISERTPDGAQRSGWTYAFEIRRGGKQMSVWNQPRATPPILIPESFLAKVDSDPESLTHAALTCVVNLLSRGHYRPNELPPRAIQFYHAYMYYLEVPNGGHSQYIHNTRVGVEPDEARDIFESAHAGLVAMGATVQANLLQKMMGWVDANPESADEQTGFEGGRAEELEPLDGEFYDAEEENSIVKCSAAWIKSWSELQPVDDAGFDAACAALAEANPKRLVRAAAARTRTFEEAATEPFSVGIALAVSMAGETLLRINDIHETEIEGSQKMAWRIHTDRGVRYADADEDGVSVYEFVELEGERASLAVPARAGAVLGRVHAETIDEFISRALKVPFAAGADLLLRRARPDKEEAVLSPGKPVGEVSLLAWLLRQTADANPIFHIFDGDEIFLLSQKKDSFVLSAKTGNETHGPVKFAEVERYAESLTD
jgi:hypothetical protein